MVRVGFALGSWQVVALAAGLAEADARAVPGRACEDHLVLYETVAVSSELKAAMQGVGAAVRPWRSIVDAFDLMASVQRRIGQRELDALIATVRAHLGIDVVDELWLCWLTRAPEKLVAEAWPDARIHFFEDGLFSYLPQRPTPVELPPASLRWPARWQAQLRDALDARRPVRRFRRYKSWLDPRHAARIDAAWMLLADLWPPPPELAGVPWHAVAPERLRAVLAACSTLPSVAGFRIEATERPAFLVLGQTLSRWGVLTREQELAVYAGAIATAVERGYDVWWKEHPRARQPFFADLAAAAQPGRLRELELPFALPVELVAERMHLAGCAAGISTAIFYLPRLYGIAAFTFADALAPFMSDRWALQNELVRRSAAALSELPAAPALSPSPSLPPLMP